MLNKILTKLGIIPIKDTAVKPSREELESKKKKYGCSSYMCYCTGACRRAKEDKNSEHYNFK